MTAAADELVEHLRNENDRLRAQINDLRHEAASIRSTKDEQQAAYQKLLMEEDQKIKQLSEEIERLQNLQSAMDEKNENGQLNMFGSSQIGSDTYDGLNMKVPRKRSRNNEADAEVMVIPCSIDQVRCDPVNETPSGPSKQIVSSTSDLDIDQPECCRRKIGLSGGVAATGPSNCIFQELTECLLDMKLSTATQTEGICISALHQSSGYSFSLTWANKAGGDEVEVLYRVLSLGTFERVAPEWMREVIVFSLRMCPIFFERISRVIKPC
ncbi:uncharacterized protein LOC127797293 isoform X2 [Diospyros lotus]|uniref:uncharacterized protein LOC127797293 isoform X2 n=1 Tax=Diospyros lotus TaxID=55363 RepID=UPI002253ECC1|nr:uncharacterized protein LOC127797293 isoform X2 [Diospyros lotus]